MAVVWIVSMYFAVVISNRKYGALLNLILTYIYTLQVTHGIIL